MPNIIVYQGRGKSHIRFIRDSALTIWRTTDNGIRKLWNDCLRQAMDDHVRYLSQGNEIRVMDIEMKDSIETEDYSG